MRLKCVWTHALNSALGIRAFKKNKCKLGADCRFIHVDASGTIIPTGGMRAPAAPVPAAPVRAVFVRDECRDFQKGKCKMGSDCRYSHGSADAAAPTTVSAITLPAGQEHCRDFSKGRCQLGKFLYFRICAYCVGAVCMYEDDWDEYGWSNGGRLGVESAHAYSIYFFFN